MEKCNEKKIQPEVKVKLLTLGKKVRGKKKGNTNYMSPWHAMKDTITLSSAPRIQ